MMSIYSITKHASLVALTMIVVVLPGALLGVLVVSHALISFAPIEDPNIVVQDGRETLLLPDKFKDFIETAFPAFRIPDEEDLIGLWATYIFPFVRWGDFNGDGLTDIAVIIINDQAYKALIAHKTTDDYEIGLMIDERDFDPPEKLGGTSGPQGLSLEGLPTGEQYQFGSDASFARGKVTFSHPLDSVGFTLDERETTIFFWENGKYEELAF